VPLENWLILGARLGRRVFGGWAGPQTRGSGGGDGRAAGVGILCAWLIGWATSFVSFTGAAAGARLPYSGKKFSRSHVAF